MNKSRQYGLFTDVPDELWNDWHWQVANRIETLEDLKKYISLTPEEEEGVAKCLGTLRMAITPYYLSLINPNDPYDPVRRQCIPSAAELYQAPEDQLDPLHEDTDSPVPGLTHRYPDRVLFLITDQCSMYCRHCTRRRFAGQHDTAVPDCQIEKCLDYIRNHTEVRDVLLSGGDALMQSDEKLEYIISELRKMPHVEIVRLGSFTRAAEALYVAQPAVSVAIRKLEAELDLQDDAASKPPEPELGDLHRNDTLVADAISRLQDRQPFNLDELLANTEHSYIEAALRLTNGNVSQAARMLGINRTTLYNRMESLAREP